MSMSKPFHVVDVFSGTPFAGNPVAVVLAPDEADESMHRIASWTGMPETVFVTRPSAPEADYALRIFSPIRELAFAGHPSLGACHLLLERGLITPREGVVRQECPAGIFEMRINGESGNRSISFTVLAEQVEPLTSRDRDAVGDALGTAPEQVFLVEAGARWIVARFADADTLDGLRPAFDRILELTTRLGVLGISVYGPSPDADADLEVRSFAPSIGVDEDAVCGGGNACVGAAVAFALAEDVPVVALTVSQGRHLGRRGRVRLLASRLDRTVLVSGEAVTTVSGTVRMPARDRNETSSGKTMLRAEVGA